MTRFLITTNSDIPIGCQYIFSLGCPDRIDIVSTLSTSLSDIGAWTTEADFFPDPGTGWFFTRQAIRTDMLGLTVEELRKKFAEPVGDWGPEIRRKVTNNAVSKCAVILVTKEGHYSQNLLDRVAQPNHPMEVAAVIGNHRNLEPLVAAYDISFYHVSFPKDAVDKRKAFGEVDEIADAENPDVIVLTRFMWILSPNLCEEQEGRAINTRHSLLPSFVGTRPYLQVYRRGVKFIGTICRYATEDLDDDPIIEQDVMRVSYKYTAVDTQRKGRNAEKQVLACGLRWHLKDRVQAHGNRTVVLRQITVMFQQVFGESSLSDKAGRAYTTKEVSPVDSDSECITTFDQEKQ